MSEASPREQTAHALKQASRAAKQGDIAAAERWSKTAERMAAAAQRLADLPKPAPDYANEEERRAELRARLAKFVACSLDIQAWEAERDAYAEKVRQAELTGTPMPEPLRMSPAGPRDLERIITD